MSVLRRGGRRARAAQGARLRVVVAAYGLGLAPALLAVAALAAHAWRRHGLAARLLGLIAAAAALALLLTDSASAFAGGHRDLAFGDSVPGFALGLRLDGPGLAIACMAAVATLAALLDDSREGEAVAALLVCLLGAVVASLAANVLTLFAGVEIGSVGGLLLTAAGTRRVGRGARLGFALQHLAALGLLAAAIELQAIRGTGDLLALAASPLPTAVALIWALVAAVRLVSPAVVRGGAGVPSRLAWSGIAAAPTGVILLIRLAQASGGDVATPVATSLATAGVVVALLGVGMAAHSRRDPARTGRALCLTGAGYVIAAAGLTGGAGHPAFAAVALFLEITLVSSPAWMASGVEPADRRWRWIAALALAAAGGLPLGFGTTALMLELGAVAARGPAGLLLLGGLGVASAGAAVTAALAVRHVLAGAAAPAGRAWLPVPWAAIPALAVSMVAALVPGLAVDTVIAALAPGVDSTSIDAGALLGAGGAWAGGYLGLAALIVVAGVVSALVLAGVPAPEWEAVPPVRLRPPRPRLRRELRRALTLRRIARASVQWLDDRLVAQPQLLVVVAAVALTVLLFR